MIHFNPRSREGSDTEEYCKLPNKLISIHAPARGATVSRQKKMTDKRNFNPRSREGSDAILPPFLLYSSNFNPRSREGSDNMISYGDMLDVVISIHAPARGATVRREERRIMAKLISIHAPARGATSKRSNVCSV